MGRRDSRVQAWDSFWECTSAIFDVVPDTKPQRDAQASIDALVKMNLPIAAIDELVTLVHAVHEIGESANTRKPGPAANA